MVSTTLFTLFISFIPCLALAGPLTTSPVLHRRGGLVPSVGATAIPLSPSGGGTYPRLTTVDGDILAAYTYTSGDDHVLEISRSTDGGMSFQALGTVATAPAATTDLDNPNLVQLPNGNVLAAFRNHDKSGTTYTYYRITVCISTDGGATWSFLSQANERAATATKNGLWEPFLRISDSNTLQIYYAAENSDSDQDILMQTSTDNGATWSSPATVAGATTTGRDGMPGVAQYTYNGANYLVCVFETTEGTGTFTVKSVYSTDDGATWGTRSQVFVPTGTDNNAGAPQVVTKMDGDLVVSFMTDEDTSEHAWTSGADFKILTSAPAAPPLTWGDKTTVTGVQSNWPGLYAIPAGGVLGCADYNGAICHRIDFSET